jgi:hypothetical protein
MTQDAQSPAALLDQLVDGELGEAERESLLRTLDREPDGWKRCALAFLEAQAWREAASDAGMRIASNEVRSGAGRRRPAVLRQLVAVAAVVAVAFCVGFVSRDVASSGVGAHATGPVAQGPAPGGGLAASAVQVTRAEAAPAPAVPEFLRLQMERQGYRIQGDRRVVPVALGDGRKVAVPVDTVSMRYVGQRVY